MYDRKKNYGVRHSQNMDSSPVFGKEHVPSFLQNSSPMINAFLAVVCNDEAENVRTTSIRPTPTKINGNIVIEIELLELACTTREALNTSFT